MGAAVIATKACLRAGAGLVTVCVPELEKQIVQISIPEAMLEFREQTTLTLEKYTAIAMGPGIGIGVESKKIIQHILTNYQKPIVLDADALTLLSEDFTLVSNIPSHSILTPHQGEFDRLFGVHEYQEHRLQTARRKAHEWNCIFVMKGRKTVIITPTQEFQNTTGNAGLAKGGSGDALTGILCAFLSQGYSPTDAAQLAVYIHGLAADLALENQSIESLLISDVIDYLGKAFEKIRS